MVCLIFIWTRTADCRGGSFVVNQAGEVWSAQGSILGPLLFICYINNLPPQCQRTIPSLYADETAISATGPNPEVVSDRLQNDLDRLYIWFARNKLSVNCLKTNAILFTSNRSRYKGEKLKLALAGEQIIQTDCVKYLGLYLDPHLNFDFHVKKLCSKINVRTKLLWRIRNFITQDLALSLYRSLIEPHFGYCSFILEGCAQSNISKLQVQQNNSLRAVKRVYGHYPTAELYVELHVDNIALMMEKSTCKFAYKCFYDLCPKPLNDMLILDVKERDLRSNKELNAIVPKCRTQWAERNFAFRAIIYWNALSVEMKAAVSVDSFKNRIKKYDGITYT